MVFLARSMTRTLLFLHSPSNKRTQTVDPNYEITWDVQSSPNIFFLSQSHIWMRSNVKSENDTLRADGPTGYRPNQHFSSHPNKSLLIKSHDVPFCFLERGQMIYLSARRVCDELMNFGSDRRIRMTHLRLKRWDNSSQKAFNNNRD